MPEVQPPALVQSVLRPRPRTLPRALMHQVAGQNGLAAERRGLGAPEGPLATVQEQGGV
jgi:hypothetical protein